MTWNNNLRSEGKRYINGNSVWKSTINMMKGNKNTAHHKEDLYIKVYLGIIWNIIGINRSTFNGVMVPLGGTKQVHGYFNVSHCWEDFFYLRFHCFIIPTHPIYNIPVFFPRVLLSSSSFFSYRHHAEPCLCVCLLRKTCHDVHRGTAWIVCANVHHPIRYKQILHTDVLYDQWSVVCIPLWVSSESMCSVAGPCG